MLKGNKLTDKRLMKMVEQCKPKQIVDYIRQNCPKGNPDSGGAGKKGGKKGKGGKTDTTTTSLVRIKAFKIISSVIKIE